MNPKPQLPACCDGLCFGRGLGRRGFTAGLALLATGVSAQDPDRGVRDEVGKISRAAKLIPPEELEAQSAQQYAQLVQGARNKGALLPAEHPQVQRLRDIARRLVPYAQPWNERAPNWQWSVNVLASNELNAFCMPGGKIAFYTGILQRLQLDDDEVAMVMGHEMAHALREHARERVGKSVATRGVIELGAALFGVGQLGRMAADAGGNLLMLRFGRDDETEADLVGMDLGARAGYDPRAAARLWQKMQQVSQKAPPQWMSTHPSSGSRIRELESKLPLVMPLYQKAARPPKRYPVMAETAR